METVLDLSLTEKYAKENETGCDEYKTLYRRAVFVVRHQLGTCRSGLCRVLCSCTVYTRVTFTASSYVHVGIDTDF